MCARPRSTRREPGEAHGMRVSIGWHRQVCQRGAPTEATATLTQGCKRLATGLQPWRLTTTFNFFSFQQTCLCSSVRMALPCPLVGSTAYRGSSSSTQAFGACHPVHRKTHRSNVCKGKPQRSKTAGVKHIELMREARCNTAPAVLTVAVSL